MRPVMWFGRTFHRQGALQIFDPSTISGTGVGGDPYTVADAGITPVKIQPSATNGQLLGTDATGAVAWVDAPTGSGGSTELADQITIQGDGTAGNEFSVADGSISSTKITDGTISPIDIGNDAVETDKILNAAVTPLKIEPSTQTEQFLSTDATGTVVWADLPPAASNPAAVDVTFEPTGNTTSEDVQAAIEELQTEIDGISLGGASNPNDELITSFTLSGTSLNIAEGATLQPPLDLDRFCN